ncbi:MAG: type I methionyl aminopeptidase, partial [Syntrophobacterales bacterium]
MKYKKCCLGKSKIQHESVKNIYAQKYNIRLKEKQDIKSIQRAGRLVLKTIDLVETQIKAGITTDEINTLVHEFTIKNGATPAPLNYRGFPKSVCVSINEEICHGIPGERNLQDGDIVNVDVTSILNGYYADANKTFFVGNPRPEAQKIVKVARESLKVALAMVRPGNTIGDIGWAIQKYAEGEGCSVVEEFTGHGIGF